MKLHFPRIPPDDETWRLYQEKRRRERLKIIAELREKYSAEFHTASWWKKFLLELRIHREAQRIYRQRLYSTRRCFFP